MKRGDDRKLYQLYRKVTPQGVSQLEAPTYREWKALHSGDQTGGQGREHDENVARGRGQRSSRARADTRENMGRPGNPNPPEVTEFGISLLGDSGATARVRLR